MLPNVIAMIFGFLIKSKGGGKLGEKDCDDVGKFPQNRNGVASADQLAEFLANSLACNVFEEMLASMNGIRGLFLDGEAENRGKTNGAQDSQPILLKSCLRISHTSDHLVLQILLPAKAIYQALCGVICHCINGEISAGEIVAEILGEGHARGVTVVLIVSVKTIGGDLQKLALVQNGNRSVLHSGFDDTMVQKAGCGLLGERICGQIPIVRDSSKQRIADTSANGIGFKSMLLQASNCKFCAF